MSAPFSEKERRVRCLRAFQAYLKRQEEIAVKGDSKRQERIERLHREMIEDAKRRKIVQAAFVLLTRAPAVRKGNLETMFWRGQDLSLLFLSSTGGGAEPKHETIFATRCLADRDGVFHEVPVLIYRRTMGPHGFFFDVGRIASGPWVEALFAGEQRPHPAPRSYASVGGAPVAETNGPR